MATIQDPELPQYTRRTSNAIPSGSEHTSALENSKGRKWLSLTVKSRSSNSKLPPLFLERDVIQGRVELDLDKPETIKGVVISVKGGTTSVGQEEILFLDINQDLWTPAMGDAPRVGGGKPSSKFSGQYSWPFSITLPKDVTVPESKGKENVYRLPASFSERASPAYIDYRLIVTIKRPALKVNQTLSVNFGYMPVAAPDPPSALRQLAYREGTPLIGPDGDPEGWKVLTPVTVKGTLFDTRQVEVECTLAIATPLCFALSSPIPLVLKLTSSDTQALDILSAPSAINAFLVRSLANGSDATDEDVQRRSNNFFMERTARASFWQSAEGAPEAFIRVLQGELEIKKGTKPSFVFPRFTVRYVLDLLTFSAPGFVPADSPDTPLLTEKITIVSAQSPGVVPRSHVPPGYEHQQGDYNKSMGLLENGNQRFYHHHGTGGIGQ